jgi:hypothetical protein
MTFLRSSPHKILPPRSPRLALARGGPLAAKATTNMTATERPITHAIYKNLVTGEVYKMSFFSKKPKSLARAWDLVRNTVTAATGWNCADIKVVSVD